MADNGTISPVYKKKLQITLDKALEKIILALTQGKGVQLVVNCEGSSIKPKIITTEHFEP